MEMFIHLFSKTKQYSISSPCIRIKECPNVPPVQVSDDPLQVLHLEGECCQAVTNLLDDVHLLHHKLFLDEVTEVEVLLLSSHSLQVLQGLGHRLLQLQHSSHGLHRSAPLH